MARQTSKVTTDHEEIRRWVEARGGWPASVKGTGEDGDPGVIRIDFPGYSGEDTLEPISWDDWFRKFDEKDLAFLYQDRTAGGEESYFNELVSRDTVQERLQRAKRTTTRASAPSTRSRATRATGTRAKASTTRAATKTAKKSAKKSARTTAKTTAKKSAKTTAKKSAKTTARSKTKSAGASKRAATTRTRARAR
jgi:hypothetical protein